VTPLAQALQGASSERVDVAAMGLDVVRYRGRLDLAGSKAQLAQRLAPQLMSTPLPILAVAIPVVWIAVAEV
jgi:predicted amidohydrolase